MNIWHSGAVALFMLGLPIGLSAAAPDQSVRPSIRANEIIKPSKINQVTTARNLAPTDSVRPQRRSFSKKPETTSKTQTGKKPNFFERLKRKKPAKREGNLFPKRIKKGSVCGVSGIQGAHVKRVPGRIRGCGVAEPVRITAVDGVVLSQPAVIDCPTAKALHLWVKKSVIPTVGRKGGGVKSLKVAAHYACRTRNNRKGARISEHGKGRAIDISAINLNDGSSLTVLKDWRSRNSKIMRAIHKGACGPFGTVLGPKSDRYHQDHFHFDTARYRSGPYCR